MSFYASSPPPPSDPAASPQPPTAWPAALDQLILQQAQSSQMGALRRQSSTIADALPSEMPNYGPPPDNDRLLLEAFGNQNIARNTMRQSTPNQVETPAPQTYVYRQTWERPGMGINGCNVANLPQEAIQMVNDLSLDTAPVEDFASRSRPARPMGLGPYVKCLMNFHEEQQRTSPNCTLENFWKPLFEKYFAHDATMHMDIKSENSQESRSIKLPVEALPRIWKSKFDGGVREERLLMENPFEFFYPDGFVVVDSQKTVILTTYEQSTVITNGHLRVCFSRDRKIKSWHFSPRNHQEWVPISTQGFGAPPPSAISKCGMPLNILRLMYIAESIGGMSSRIESELSRLLNRSAKSQQPQTQPRPQEQKPAVSYAGISKGESNGNAYHALLSQLGGVQGMPLHKALGDAPLGNAATGSRGPPAPTVQGLAGTVVQGLQNNLGVGLKQSIVNGDPNNGHMRESIGSWRADQANDIFSNILQDSIRTSFPQREGDLASGRATQNRDELEAQKKIGSNLTEAQGVQGGHSVVDAVTAAASGRGGWGVGSTEERNFAGNEPHGQDLDASLQLHSVTNDGSINLQSGGEPSVANAPGQSAPPGLSIFTPQSEELEKNGKSQTARRKSQNAALRDVSASSGRPASNGNHKNFNGVRSFQRMSTNRLKRGNQTNTAPNISGSSVGANAIRASQGVNNQNGGTSSKGKAHGNPPKPIKELGQGVTGVRRSSQRSSGADGREKRQKTSQGGNHS